MIEVTAKSARMWSRLGQRGSIFGAAIPDLAKSNGNLRVVTADLGLLSGLERLKTACENQYLNVGIAEQDMIGIAVFLRRHMQPLSPCEALNRSGTTWDISNITSKLLVPPLVWLWGCLETRTIRWRILH